jgi:hypothetical protein
LPRFVPAICVKPCGFRSASSMAEPAGMFGSRMTPFVSLRPVNIS